MDYEPNVGGAGCKRGYPTATTSTSSWTSWANTSDRNRARTNCWSSTRDQRRRRPLHAYFDYFIWQAYSTSSDSGLNTYISTVIRNGSGYGAGRAVHQLYTTVPFEQYAAEGGALPRAASEGFWGRLSGNPHGRGKTYRKARIRLLPHEYEYYLSGKSGFYPWTRQAINAVHRSENEEGPRRITE
ncbi:MAG: hypothetical protein ACLRM8_02190 [Alistipes sp.]